MLAHCSVSYACRHAECVCTELPAVWSGGSIACACVPFHCVSEYFPKCTGVFPTTPLSSCLPHMYFAWVPTPTHTPFHKCSRLLSFHVCGVPLYTAQFSPAALWVVISIQCDFGQTLTLLNEPLCCHVLCNACLHLTCAGKHSPHLPSQFNTLHYKELSPAMSIGVWLVPAPVGVNTLTSLECFTSFYESNLDHIVMLLCDCAPCVCPESLCVCVWGDALSDTWPLTS